MQDKRNPGDSAEAGDRSGVFASNPTGNPNKVNSVSTHVKGRAGAAPGRGHAPQPRGGQRRQSAYFEPSIVPVKCALETRNRVQTVLSLALRS